MRNSWGDEPVAIARRPRRSRRWIVPVAMVVALASCMVVVGWAVGRLRSSWIEARGVVPADFEHHEGLVLALPANIWDSELNILADIASLAHDRTHVFVLASDDAVQARMADLLTRRQVPDGAVTFSTVPLDSPWIRDFGPINIKTFAGSLELFSMDYLGGGQDEEGRYRDARAPFALGNTLGYPSTRVPLCLDGGNLLSNGAGLCLATRAVLDENAERYGYSQRQVNELLRKQLGARDMIYLDCLDGEPNQHIDMFVTFTAADVAVVGRCDPEEDPANAVILDRNAARLQGHPTAFGPLRVERIPMPPRDREGTVTSYTNLAYVNQRVLVPTYPSLSDPRQAEAFDVLRRLLPRRELIAVDVEALMKKGGALHCVTLNLYRVPGREAVARAAPGAAPGAAAVVSPRAAGNTEAGRNSHAAGSGVE